MLDLIERADKIKKDLEELPAEFAKIYYDALINNILTNRYGFTVTSSTINSRIRKKSKGAPPLIDTQAYIKSIIITDEHTVTVSGGVHPNSSLSFKELAFVLEYGRKDKHAPAFPVWRKTMEDLKPEFVKRIKEVLNGK